MLAAARVWSALRHTATGRATPHDLDDPVRVDAHDMVPALLQDSVVGAEMAVYGASTATPFHGILRAAGLEDCRCEVPSSKQQDQQHGHYQGAVRHSWLLRTETYHRVMLVTLCSLLFEDGNMQATSG